MHTLDDRHHAYAVEGPAEKVRMELWSMFEKKWGTATRGNPDFSYQKFESLNVDDARHMRELQENKAFSAGKKVFVIEADSITAEAQNSLLKMFEEPAAGTHFFLIGGCVKNLLPTLASRIMRVRSSGAAPAAGAAVSDFLHAPLAKRLLIVKKLADDIKNEKKTKADAVAFLDDIEKTLYLKTLADGKLPEGFFENLEKCRDYMTDRSAGVKMLLEYMALIIPVIE